MLPFHVNVPTGTAIVDKRLLHNRLPSVLILTLSEPSSVLSPQPRFRIGMQGCQGCAHHSLSSSSATVSICYKEWFL